MPRALVLATAILAGALLGGASGQGAPGQEPPTLHARVGPGFSISLTNDSGQLVTNLQPGTYAIEVEDESVEHNFRLTGPGVTQQTPVEEIVRTRWVVTFVEGTYTYFCVPHSTTMRGTFTVGTPPAPTPPPANVVTPRSRLVLTSGPGFAITLKTAVGKVVKRMRTGTYRFTVRDRSSAHNAHVIAPGVNRRTAVPFVGTQRWRVRLRRPGKLRFLCDPHASQGMRGSARIVR